MWERNGHIIRDLPLSFDNKLRLQVILPDIEFFDSISSEKNMDPWLTETDLRTFWKSKRSFPNDEKISKFNNHQFLPKKRKRF